MVRFSQMTAASESWAPGRRRAGAIMTMTRTQSRWLHRCGAAAGLLVSTILVVVLSGRGALAAAAPAVSKPGPGRLQLGVPGQ